jgi:hypothetical protein
MNPEREQIKNRLRTAKTQNEIDQVIRENPITFAYDEFLNEYAYWRRHQIIKSKMEVK